MSDQVEEAVDQVLASDLTEGFSRNHWSAAIIQRLEKRKYYGCVYQGILAEWHPTEELLREIAKEFNRNYEQDMTDNSRKFLIEVTANYHKKNGY